MQKNIVAELQLAGQGKQKIEWVKRNMPILRQIEDDFRKHQYFSGLRVLDQQKIDREKRLMMIW